MRKNNKPIRVAQIMTEMNYGGVEMVVMNYYRYMDRSKIQFDFFVLEGSEIPQREEIEKLGGRIYIVPHYKHLIKYEKALIHLFKENHYKIVHSHMNTLSIFSLRAAKKAGVSVRIAHNHSTAGKGEYKKNFVKYLLRPLAKFYPTELFACSRLAGDWLYGNKTNYTVFNNAISMQKFAYDEQIRNRIRKEYNLENKYVIGHVGRFCYQKNHDFLIDIFNEIYQKLKNTVLLLVGNGELEDEIRAKVHSLGLDESVIFAGVCNNVNEMYQAMDVFVLPSRYEGLPVVGVEAQAAGLPCVFSNKITDEIVFTDTAVRCGLEEHRIWTDVILKYALEKPDRRKRSFQLKNFEIESQARNLLIKYMELIGK